MASESESLVGHGGLTRRRFLEAAGVTLAASMVAGTCGCSLFSRSGSKSSPPATASFVSRPDLKPPLITTSHTDSSASGLIFLTASGPLIVDQNGSPIWYLPTPSGTSVADFKLQQLQTQPVLTWWQGNVESPGFGQGEHVVMDTRYGQVRTVQAAAGYQADLHDFLMTPEGTALLTAYHPVGADLSALGGSRNGQLMDCVLQEIDLASGQVLLEWHARDHVDPSESRVAVPTRAGQLYDYFHLNSIDIGPDGNLLISARNTWALYKLQRKTGEVLWRLGGNRSDFPVDSSLRFAFQHDARWHGPGTMTLFDDGAGPPNVESRSRGLRLTVDETLRTVSLQQDFAHAPDILATSQGNMQVLDNGNLFVGWGSQPYFSEHAPSGVQLFSGKLATNQSYRAFRFPWSGQPTSSPAIATRRDSSTAEVYVSWNGATEVARWEIDAGTSPSALSPVMTVARSGFETRVRVGMDRSYVAARALDATGNQLGMSPTVKF